MLAFIYQVYRNLRELRSIVYMEPARLRTLELVAAEAAAGLRTARSPLARVLAPQAFVDELASRWKAWAAQVPRKYQGPRGLQGGGGMKATGGKTVLVGCKVRSRKPARILQTRLRLVGRARGRGRHPRGVVQCKAAGDRELYCTSEGWVGPHRP